LEFGEDAIDARWFEVDWREGSDGRFALSLHSDSLVLGATLEGDGAGGFLQTGADGIAFDHAQILAKALEAS
jgi:hypothetical protein